MTTETQPDPQVEPDEDPRVDALRCVQCEFRTDDSPGGWYELSEHQSATGHRYEHVRPARKPLTLADIPAGQGAASLFIAPADVLGYTDGNAALWIQTEDGPLFIRWAAGPGASVGDRAMWDVLAANVPTIDTGKVAP